MANPEHVEIVKQGKAAIAAWQAANPGIHLDLLGADLIGANLDGANLDGANLDGADLDGADLTGADLSGAWLWFANLIGTKLDDARFEDAALGGTILADVDLSKVKGLESIHHLGPSTIGVDTLFKSQGKIPETFLRGCGVPEGLITYLPALLGTMQPIQYQSCFISYSSRDDEFARRLHGRMRDEKLRVWFAPEDMRGGKKIGEQIDRAIQLNDRLLLVLSEHSMKSEWVKTEIRKARKVELRENRQKLFPIRLVNMTRLEKWKCLATEPDEDLAAEVRSYHIPNFSHWKDHDAFEAAFADLLDDLRKQA